MILKYNYSRSYSGEDSGVRAIQKRRGERESPCNMPVLMLMLNVTSRLSGLEEELFSTGPCLL